MKLRKVKTNLLIKKSIAYRILVIFTQILFMWTLTGNISFAIGSSILWNMINTVEYFGFDYVFARLFKVGDSEK